ncbi:MAG: amidohydrolase [Clostridia bacterium]|nr:amidohydrolase [Clostridia bacterium]
MNREILKKLTDENYKWAVEKRRALHRIPEEGFKEFKTQKLICDTLDELGIPYTTERTWVVGLIEGAQPGKTIALRADIDALPVQEPKGCNFRSEHEGWMHACGHDIHTAIQLGAARLLAGLREQLRGNVKLLFQPAEETTGGALPMVNAGVLENPRVDASYGLHLQPYLPLGTVEARHGALNAACDEIEIIVHGRGGHAAYPENSVDAIVCAAQIISALQTLVSRNVSPLSSMVLTFGTIEGGRASNVICDRVRLFGTLRTVDPKLRALGHKRIREIAQSVALAFGASAEVNVMDGYSVLINHDRETDLVLDLATELFGKGHVKLKAEPSMGGEDFSYFIEDRPGAFYHIGCTPIDRMPAAALHSPHFCADERCIHQGMMMQSAIVLKEMGVEL